MSGGTTHGEMRLVLRSSDRPSRFIVKLIVALRLSIRCQRSQTADSSGRRSLKISVMTQKSRGQIKSPCISGERKKKETRTLRDLFGAITEESDDRVEAIVTGAQRADPSSGEASASSSM
jgi:hypothetical protein